MNWAGAVFGASAAIALVGALCAVGLKSIFHNILGFALAMLGVAGVFLSLGSDFLAVVFALVYVGAVSLLGLHLLHGAHSMFESLGLRHRRVESLLFGFARVAALAISVGLALAPAAVFLRMIGG